MIGISKILEIVSLSTNIDINEIKTPVKTNKSKDSVATARALTLKYALEYTLSSKIEIASYLNLTAQWPYYSLDMLDRKISGFDGHDTAKKIVKLMSEIEAKLKDI